MALLPLYQFAVEDFVPARVFLSIFKILRALTTLKAHVDRERQKFKPPLKKACVLHCQDSNIFTLSIKMALVLRSE